MTTATTLVALVGFGFVTTAAVHAARGGGRSVASPLAVVGLVLLAASSAGILGAGVLRVLLPAVLGSAGVVGVVGLCLGTLRDDAQLATAGYWTGSSSFAVPVALVGSDALTVAAGTGVTLLVAMAYGAVAERTPARTVTVGSREGARDGPRDESDASPR